MTWTRKLKTLRACEEAVEWGKQFDTIDEAWQKCENGEWMLWLLGKLLGEPETASRKKLVLCACECARLALPHVEKGETRPQKAIETAEAWAKGDDGITLEMVKDAANATDASYAAANATSHAAYAAADAADASYAVANAAYAVANAADAASHAAARLSTLKQCADIVRKHYLVAPKI